MGREQPLKGEAGEYAVLPLLRQSFSNSAKTIAGAPLDWTCSELRVTPGSTDLYVDPALRFHFQVKTYDQPSFDIGRETFRNWTTLSEYEPVILVSVKLRGGGGAQFSYLAFHDWLISRMGREAMTSKAPVRFGPRDHFEKVDPQGSNFHRMLVREAERASANSASPWTTLRDYGLFPFDESMLLQYTELVAFAEVPNEIAKRLADFGSSARHVIRAAVEDGQETDELINKWIEGIKTLTPQLQASSFQRRQFARFVRTLNRFPDGIRLPRFRIGEVSCWRAFVSMYPHSLRMLDHIARSSKNENDLMFASALLPMLAVSNNVRVSGEARDISRRIQMRQAEFGSYAFQREMYRGAAEAGDRLSLKKGIDFIAGKSSVASERMFLEAYGWPDDALSANLHRKLTYPARRDVFLKEWYDAMANILLGRNA